MPIQISNSNAIPPDAPVLATALAGTTITATWTDVAREGHYVLERATDGVTFTTLITLASGVTSYADTGLADGTYTYRLKAVNPYGTSAASNTDAETIGGIGPPPSTDFLGYRPQLYPEYGMGTVGGRGDGSVTPRLYRVTTTADTGAAAVLQGDGTYRGEYRAALTGNPWAGPRFVIFEVSGYIDLHSDISVEAPYCTVAGQTAPAPGVVIRSVNTGASTEAMHLISTHDIVLQHYRIVPGWYTSGASPSICNSGIQLYPTRNHYRVLMDHLTLMWHQDEGIQFGYPLPSTANGGQTDATAWRCLVAEGMSYSPGADVCSGGGASAGHGIGGVPRRAAVIQCVLAHNVERNPWWSSSSGIILNNLVYNWWSIWGIVFSDGNDIGYPGLLQMSVVGNRLIVGPSTAGGDAHAVYVNSYGSGASRPGQAFYLADNTIDQAAFPAASVTAWTNLLSYDPRVGAPPTDAAIPTGYTVLPSASLEAAILPHVGAWPLARLSFETRVLAELTARTGTYKAVVSDGGGYPALTSTTQAYTLPSNPWAVADSVGRLGIEVASLEPLALGKEPAATKGAAAG